LPEVSAIHPLPCYPSLIQPLDGGAFGGLRHCWKIPNFKVSEHVLPFNHQPLYQTDFSISLPECTQLTVLVNPEIQLY